MMHEIILAGVAFFHPHAQIDSLGVETVNGKVHVIHKVDEKETLYAIARRYGASIDDIKSSNPGLTSALEVGQIIKVPYGIKSQAERPAGSTTHKVAAGETMYSISRSYGISVSDLRSWNNLQDNTLAVGQELVVKKPSAATSRPVQQPTTETNDAATQPPSSGMHTVATKETLYSIARKYGITVSQIKQWNQLTSDELQVGQSIYVVTPSRTGSSSVTTAAQQPIKTEEPRPANEPRIDETPARPAESNKAGNDQTASSTPKPNTIRISESLKNSDEITEAGVAELIEGTEGNRKYLALHRTAPVGTILKVRNEMNNREVFVRVMGKLPDNAINNKVLIKISRSAYDRLGAIDPKFRVELTYYK